MGKVPEDLTAFLIKHRDSRAYTRGLAVKLALAGYLYDGISDMLAVSPAVVSQWKKAYAEHGTEGLTLKYKGAVRYLQPEEHPAVLVWLDTQTSWSVDHLKEHIEQTYAVVFQSRQS